MNKYVDLIVANGGTMTEREFIEQSKEFNQKTPQQAWLEDNFGQAMAALGRAKTTLPNVVGEVAAFFPVYNAEGEKSIMETTESNIQQYSEAFRAFREQKTQKAADQAVKAQNEQHLLEEQTQQINQSLFPGLVEPVVNKVEADSMVEADLAKELTKLDPSIVHHSHSNYVKPGQYKADFVKIDKNKKVVAVVELDSYKYHHARQRDHKKTAQRNAYYLKNKHALMVIYADNVLRNGAKKVAKWVVTALGKS
jgi:hypothetical protein